MSKKRLYKAIPKTLTLGRCIVRFWTSTPEDARHFVINSLDMSLEPWKIEPVNTVHIRFRDGGMI